MTLHITNLLCINRIIDCLLFFFLLYLHFIDSESQKVSLLFGMELGMVYDFQSIQELTLKYSEWAPLYWLIRIQILNILIAKTFLKFYF